MRIGVDLGGSKIEIAALDDDGAFLLRRRVSSPRDYPGAVRAIVDLVRAAESETGRTGTIGLGIPGAISPATGLVKNANSTWLNGQTFDRDLSAALAREVRVANDANCFALSEAIDGAGRGHRTVFGVILGTGVGGGIAVEGRVLTGPNAIAGEWGHNPLPWPATDETPGPDCYCGKQGCIETWCSGPALARNAIAHLGETRAAPDIDAMARDGDSRAESALRAYEIRLGKSLAALINVLDPDAIVLGGGVSNLDRLYTNLPPVAARFAFSDAISTPILKNHWGDSGGVRGAAWLWGGP